MNQQNNRFSSWIAVIGLPNAGKSTLFNILIGNKISIVSPKAQTTRNTIKGIKTIENTQLVFIDTPGIFDPQKTLEEFMLKSLNNAISDVDQILFMHDASRDIQESERIFLQNRVSSSQKYHLLLNKIDKIDKNRLLKLAQDFQNILKFDNIFMISALKNEGIDKVLSTLISEAKMSEWYFDKSQITTAPIQFLIQEILREKILFNTHQEIPYNVYIDTEMFEDKKDILKISLIVYVLSENQKKILIGKNGDLLKKIATQTRKEAETLIKKKLFLKVFIKVRDWEKSLSLEKFLNY